MSESDWQPSESDVAWTRNLLNSLKVGGIWGTSYAVYRRVSEKKVRLDMVILGELSTPDAMIERTRKAILAAGFEYVGFGGEQDG